MKKAVVILISFLVISGVLFFLINNSRHKELSQKETTTGESLVRPDISAFSKTELTYYPDSFNKPISAILHNESAEETIQVDDERLIQLLNYIANSEDKKSSFWSQGQVEFNENLIEQPYLEVCFSDAKSTAVSEELNQYDKAVIYGNDVVLIQTAPKHDAVIYGTTCAMLMQPYMTISVKNDTSIDLLKLSQFK